MHGDSGLLIELVRDALGQQQERPVAARQWLGGMAALSDEPAVMLAGVIGQLASLSAYLAEQLAAVRGEQPDLVLVTAVRTLEATLARKRHQTDEQW